MRSLPPCGGGLGRGVAVGRRVAPHAFYCATPTPTPPHRKSGLPDLRTIAAKPGRARVSWGGERKRRVCGLRQQPHQLRAVRAAPAGAGYDAVTGFVAAGGGRAVAADGDVVERRGAERLARGLRVRLV